MQTEPAAVQVPTLTPTDVRMVASLGQKFFLWAMLTLDLPQTDRYALIVRELQEVVFSLSESPRVE